jgi:hypothetical protein
MGVGILTNVGLIDMLTAQANDTTFDFTTVSISSDVVAISPDLTILPDIVYTATGAPIVTQIVIDPNTIRTIVYLGVDVGDFNIGTFGLYDNSGTLFAVAQFPGAGSKTASSPPAQVGNIRTFYIDITYANLAALIPPTPTTFVTMRQLRVALNSMSLLGAAQSAILALEFTNDAAINWFSSAQENAVGDPLFDFLNTALSLGDGGAALFAAASAVSPP